MNAGTRGCRCMMAGGQSGTPGPCQSMSYLKDEENICDWFTLGVVDGSEWMTKKDDVL